jgi:hypothetical protein
VSLDTFDNLKKEIIDWSHRSDIDLKVDTFIKMAEQDMFANPDEILRVRGQETRSTATVDGQFLALPDDFQSMRGLSIAAAGGDVNLVMKAPSQITTKPTTGLPNSFTVTSQIEFDRVPDSGYVATIQYYAIPTPLSSSNQTNDILTKFPNIYLFGALSAVFLWAGDQEQYATAYRSYISAIKGANKKDKQGRYGPSPSMTIVDRSIA